MNHYDNSVSPRTTLIKLLFIILLLLLNPQFVTSKRQNANAKRNRRLSKAFNEAKAGCINSCDPFNMAENQMCISRCLSEECHLLIFQWDELQPGEIDDLREMKFETCVKDEIRNEISASRRGMNAASNKVQHGTTFDELSEESYQTGDKSDDETNQKNEM